MAFIGEEQRFKPKKEDPNPGLIYNPEKPNHFKSEDETMHNLVPFGTSVDRMKLKEFEDKVLNKEFPENSSGKKSKKPVLEYIRRSASFANQSERFNYYIERSPGPGNYNPPTFIGEKFLEEEKRRLKQHLHKMKKESVKSTKLTKKEKLQKEIKKEFFKNKNLDSLGNQMVNLPTGKGPNTTFVNVGKVKSLLNDKKGRYAGVDKKRRFRKVIFDFLYNYFRNKEGRSLRMRLRKKIGI